MRNNLEFATVLRWLPCLAIAGGVLWIAAGSNPFRFVENGSLCRNQHDRRARIEARAQKAIAAEIPKGISTGQQSHSDYWPKTAELPQQWRSRPLG